MALVWVGACAPANQVEPAPEPRIMCLNLGGVPGAEWWVYVCTFDSVPMLGTDPPRGTNTA